MAYLNLYCISTPIVLQPKVRYVLERAKVDDLKMFDSIEGAVQYLTKQNDGTLSRLLTRRSGSYTKLDNNLNEDDAKLDNNLNEDDKDIPGEL